MRRRRRGRIELVAFLAGIGILSTVAAVPRIGSEVDLVGEGEPAAAAADPALPAGAAERPAPAAADPAAGPAAGAPDVSAPRLACAPGRNGGATDVGVSGDRILLGATVVESGIGSAFLGDVRYGMQAVVNRVNAAGGICGRRLDLILKDDGWDANRGFGFIRNLVEGEGVFALAVVPSSEGLRVASRSGYLRRQGVPVVGSDGMLISQYTDPFIWPVAASTITAMHVIAADAYERGRRNFAIVYDANYRFGVEGAYAFNEAVRRLTGRDIPGYANPLAGGPQCRERVCGIRAGQPGYQTEIHAFNSACDRAPRCDQIVYLLEPETALTWMRGGGIGAGHRGGVEVDVAGPQPLFNRSFAVHCSQRCHGMQVWTGYVPPIEPFTSQPAVGRYLADLERTNARADAANSFVQGGYLGMSLLVEALERVGPALTREALVAAMNGMRHESGLARPLSWTAQDRFANRCMMGFTIQARPSFAGWRHTADWVCDPWPGEHIPASELE